MHSQGLYTSAYSDSLRRKAASGWLAGTVTACTQQLIVTANVEQMRVVGVQAPPRPVTQQLTASLRRTDASGRRAGAVTACTQQLKDTARIQ